MTPEELIEASRDLIKDLQDEPSKYARQAPECISQLLARISELEARVAALQKIAVELKAEEIYPYAMPTWDHLPEEDFQKKILGTEIYREYPGKKEYRNAANRMLAEEHPEAFR